MKLTYNQLENKVKLLESKIKKMSDIEKRLSNQKHFMDILINTIPNPVFYKDINGVYQTLNNAFSRTILGLAKEKIIGKSLFDLPDEIPFELAKIYEKKDNELFTNPGNQVYEGKVKCADGVIRIFYFYKSTVFDINNEVVGLIGVMLDVTELKENQSLLDDKNKLLTKLTYLDSLTGLFNRRKFDEVFKEKLENRRDNDLIMNFVLIDVDSFKKYNDTYGHIEGDNVLKVISKEIKSLLNRENDYLFRVGGEEFALLFESQTIEYARQFVEEIRKKVENINIKHSKNFNYGRVTISLGLTSLEYDTNDYIKIYKQTDKLLYQAKSNGRNRVCFDVI